MGNPEMANKRKQPRFPLISSVKYFLHHAPVVDEFDGQTINVSSSGLRLAVRKRLEVGDEIVIVVSFVSILRRKYRVRWLKENPGENDDITYEVGLISSSNGVH